MPLLTGRFHLVFTVCSVSHTYALAAFIQLRGHWLKVFCHICNNKTDIVSMQYDFDLKQADDLGNKLNIY